VVATAFNLGSESILSLDKIPFMYWNFSIVFALATSPVISKIEKPHFESTYHYKFIIKIIHYFHRNVKGIGKTKLNIELNILAH
jgi:hypothetical protein